MLIQRDACLTFWPRGGGLAWRKVLAWQKVLAWRKVLIRVWA